MKDTGDLFSKICDMDNLRKAHKNAKRGKGWYAEVKCIEKDLDHYLKRLQENLIEHRYHTSENRLAKHLSVGCLASPVKEKTM